MKNFFLVLLLIIPFLCFSQINITGTVKDSISNIEFANVILKNANNEIVSGSITNENGLFKIQSKKGKYNIIISFIGYENWVKEILVEEKDINLGNIQLIESESKLEEIVISAKRPTIKRKVDRLIFNIENSIVSSGGDAIDVLKKTPGVRVEGSNIGLIGKNSVRILINDRLSPLSGEELASYLQTLSSDDIIKIEVITNPPSKYEAEGNSGLINIVLKKVKRDYFGGNIRSTYRQATYSSVFLGGGITYQKNKLSLFTNINSGDGSIEVNETNKIFYPLQSWDTDTKIRYYTKFISGRVGIDYDITDNTSVGVQYLGTTSRPDNREKTRTSILNTTNSLDSLLLTKANSDKKTYYHSLNGHFKTVFDTIGRSMTINVDYFAYNNELDRVNNTESFLENGDLIQNSTDIFKNTSNQNINSFTSGLDFEWPTKFTNLEFGGKLSFIKNDSDVGAFNFENDIFIANSNQSNIFEYKENTQAIYASASKSIEKWDFKLGFRFELTQTEGNSITLNQINNTNYNKLFPTAYITYNPNDNNSLSLNYGKRINRPGYSSLNPFRWFSNPYSFTEGNPFLQPSFTDNFELSHTLRNNLNTSLYVSITEDGSDQITLTDTSNNIQATVRRNFLEEYSIGISQSYTFKKIKWLENYIQYDFNYSKIKSTLPNTIDEQDGVNFYAAIDNSFYFNSKKTFFGELNFWYSSPGVSGVDFITESYAADMGLKWLFLEKDLQIRLVFSDIFKTNQSAIKSIVNGINQEYRNYYDNRQLTISATYRFGNNNLRTKSKQFSNEDERSRAN
jgi:outer membrane receptor protein involved in Fe transport